MKHPLVIGLQFGDEGKGKITDVLARQADWIIRFNGGSNAGHTLWLNGKKLVTHSVPSGVLSAHTRNFIGAGCVIDPIAFSKELAELAASGAALNGERLKIDYRAHVTLPIHLALDAAREGGSHGIGTTRRGIGPTYSTKTDRSGIRVGDLYEPDCEERVRFLCRTYNALVRAAGVGESAESDNLAVVEKARELFRPYLSRESTPFFTVARKEKCVLEGAQAIHLDLDHGSYPYVTSSNTLPAYASVGTPFPHTRLGSVIGVAKAYMTRVGKGAFPTELEGADGERIRKNGGEFGSTTGRSRRVGWMNLDEMREAVRLADCSCLVITKSDVLNREPEVKALINGKLESFAGWDTVLEGGAKASAPGAKLHPNLAAYIERVEAFTGVPVLALGTGPDRDDLFWCRPQPDFWGE